MTVSEYLATVRINWVDTVDGLAEMAATLARHAGIVGLDIETAKALPGHPMAGLVPAASRISTVQLAADIQGERVCWVVDALGLGVQWMQQLQACRFIVHNLAFELDHLQHAGVVLDIERCECTMLMARVYRGADGGLSLAEVANEALDLQLDKTLQTSDWFARPLTPEQLQYAAGDAVAVLDLMPAMERAYFDQAPEYRATYEFIRSLVAPTVTHQQLGVRLDTGAHNQVVQQWQQIRDDAQAQLAEQGLHIPQGKDAFKRDDIQAYLRGRLNEEQLNQWPRTKTGNLSTSAKEIAAAPGAEQIAALTQWAKHATLLANFGPKLQHLAVDGTLYPRYRVAGMAGGRWTATEPNFQNQPRQGLKHCYRPVQEGWLFVAADLAQVELRVAGLISQDAAIMQAYADGQDLHTLMAQRMAARMSPSALDAQLAAAGGDRKAMMKRLRQGAKGINFGLLYGSGWAGLQRYALQTYGVAFSDEEAQAFHALFHESYPQLSQWQQLIVAHAREQYGVESTWCRLPRFFSESSFYKKGGFSDVFTEPMNHPVQSTAWEIMALAIRYVHQHADPRHVRISHHVYDELVLQVHPDHVLPAARLMMAGFVHGYRTVFPDAPVNSVAEAGWGETWADCSLESHVIRGTSETTAA
jgi:DNA polymerase-1